MYPIKIIFFDAPSGFYLMGIFMRENSGILPKPIRYIQESSFCVFKIGIYRKVMTYV